MLRLLMTFTDDERMVLRCRATECVGVVAVAVGKQVFAVSLVLVLVVVITHRILLFSIYSCWLFFSH